MSISAGDDGLHADTYLEIDGGNINIAGSYEGIESTEIVINGGDISVTASDDGINAADGTSSGFGGFMAGGRCNLTVSGGNLYINANGDGLDANGNMAMTGGSVIVDGPISSGNGAIDYDGTFSVSGGTLVAVGSVGMAMTPGTSSTQNSVRIALDSVQSAGTSISIRSESGTEVITHSPSKVYQSVVVSSPLLKSSETYVIYLGGTEYGRFTVSDTVTSVGGMNGGNGGRGNGNNGNMMPPDMQGMPEMQDSNQNMPMPPDMDTNMNPGMNPVTDPCMNQGINPNRNFNRNMII